MNAPLDLSPLTAQCDGIVLRFVFTLQDEILPELPADYEAMLADRLVHVLADEALQAAEVDLEDRAGISSRELGALIALLHVLRPRFGTVRLVRVSPMVRNLLVLTHTDRLFVLD